MGPVHDRVWALPLLAILLTGLVTAVGCQRDLRGYDEPSRDGKTYLVVDDDNGGECGPILVDGKEWSHPVHSPGLIEPGDHKIECGGEIAFQIKPNTTFHFDYWGP